MIGQRVRTLRDDEPINQGSEGTVTKFHPEISTREDGPCWAVDFNGLSWIIYQNWIEVIDQTPDETESFFV